MLLRSFVLSFFRIIITGLQHGAFSYRRELAFVPDSWSGQQLWSCLLQDTGSAREVTSPGQRMHAPPAVWLECLETCGRPLCGLALR